MPNLTYTYTLTNGTTADASQVMQDLNDVRTLLNGGLDGVNIPGLVTALSGTAAKIATGTATVLWTGALTTAFLDVTHGLAAVAPLVLVNASNFIGAGTPANFVEPAFAGARILNSTQFRIGLRSATTHSSPEFSTITWLAIG